MAVVEAVLRTQDKTGDNWNLVQKLGATRSGVNNVARFGRVLAEFEIPFNEFPAAKTDDLVAAIEGGNFCLVEYQAPDSDYQPEVLANGNRQRFGRSKNCGHYSIVFGVSERSNGTLLWLMDPLVNEGETDYGEGVRTVFLKMFQRRWENIHEGGNTKQPRA